MKKEVLFQFKIFFCIQLLIWFILVVGSFIISTKMYTSIHMCIYQNLFIIFRKLRVLSYFNVFLFFLSCRFLQHFGPSQLPTYFLRAPFQFKVGNINFSFFWFTPVFLFNQVTSNFPLFVLLQKKGERHTLTLKPKYSIQKDILHTNIYLKQTILFCLFWYFHVYIS